MSTGVWRRRIFSVAAVWLLSSTSLAGLTVKVLEIDAQYQAAAQRKNSRQLKELELFCDGLTPVSLRRIGLDPIHLPAGPKKTTRFNRSLLAVPDNSDDYPSFDERKEFVEALTTRMTASQEVSVWEGQEMSGLKLMSEGRYVEAEAAFLAARKASRTPGALESDLPLTLNHLASLYLKMERNAEAQRTLKESIAAWQFVPNPDNLQVAAAYNSLGMLYFRQRSYIKAQELFGRALAGLEGQLGPEHPEVAKVLCNLGTIHNCLRELAHADGLYSRALAIWKKALGPDHPLTAMGYHNLAMVRDAQGRRAEAVALLERSISIWERSEREQPNLGLSLHNLAFIFSEVRDYHRAEDLFQRARGIQERALGSDSPAVGQLLADYAALLRRMNRKREAAQLQKRADVILQQPDPERYIIDAADYASP